MFTGNEFGAGIPLMQISNGKLLYPQYSDVQLFCERVIILAFEFVLILELLQL